MTRFLPVALAAFLALLLSGCATKQTVQTAPEPVALPPPQPASPQVRAQLHTELGAGYYERGQMEVALDELNTAVKRSEEHTSELQSHSFISYAVFCLKKKK